VKINALEGELENSKKTLTKFSIGIEALETRLNTLESELKKKGRYRASTRGENEIFRS